MTLSLSSASIAEADDPETGATVENRTTVTASLDRASVAATTVTVSVAPDSPATASDFSLSANTMLTIAAGQTASTGTVTITAVDNDVDAADKTVRVKGTAANSAGATDPSDVTLTLEDDDTRGVTLSGSELDVSEGSTGTYTVVLDSEPTAEVTVTPSRSSGDTDVTVSGALTFTAGNWRTAQTVTVSAAEDADADDDSAVIGHAVAGGDYGSEMAGTVAVTVDDDEVAEPPGEPTGVTVTRNTASSLSVSWTAPEEASGVAPVTDYDVRYFRGSADPVIEAHWVEPGDRGGHDHVGTATSTTIAGLLDGATYVVQVQAVNADGGSAWSASGRGTTTAPLAVTGVVLASKPRIDSDDDHVNDTYGAGQAIAVDVTWDGEVTWDLSAAGAGMHVRLDVGGTTRTAELATGGNAAGAARTLRFRYTVATDDADADGVAVTADATGALVVLRSGATLQDAFGRAAARAHAGLAAQANHRVDGSKDPPSNRPPQCTAEERPGDLPLLMPPAFYSLAEIASCSDPDGDELAVTVSVDKPEVFSVVRYRPDSGRVQLETPEACVLAGITPALPNPVITTVTQTVTDPDGETASATRRITTNFGACPALLSATVKGAILTLTYDLPLDRGSVPAPADFVVKVDGAAVDLSATRAVAITGSSVTVTLAAAVDRDAAVTLTYGRSDTAPIQTAAGTRVLSFVDRAVVNLGRPRVASVALVSVPTGDVDGNGVAETYKKGEVVRARVTFTTAVDVVGDPALTLRFDPTFGEKSMTFDTGRSRTNTTTLEFTYTVVAPNTSPRGIGFDANALSLGDGVSIRAAGGTLDANLDFARVAHDAGHKVDAAPPRLRTSYPIITIHTWSGADETFAIGDIIEVTAYFTETVKVTTAGDPVAGPRARLAVGRLGYATYARGNGELSLVFRYTVAEGDVSHSGHLLGQNPLELNGGVIADLMGNESGSGHLAFPGTGSDEWKVDGIRPTLSSVMVDRATLVLSYSEALRGAVPDEDDFVVTVGGTKVRLADANPVAVAGKNVTLTLASAVNMGQAVTVSYTGDQNRIRDVPGNVAADFAARTVTNVTTAEVTGVALASNAGADRTYGPGDTVAVRVTFDRAVTVDTENGTPRLKIDLDGDPDSGERWAEYDSTRSAATKLVFTYQVESGDSSTRGIAVLADTMEANGGTLRSASGTDAKLAHPAVAASTSHKVDGTGPNISAAAVREATLTLTFDEALDPDSEPAASAFTVKVEGTEASLAATDPVAVAGSAVTLTLAAAVSVQAAVTVSYTAPADDPVQDTFGNDADGFTDRAVTNTTPRPLLSRATVGGDTLALFYDRSLDAASEPATGDFTVTVAGSVRGVREVHVVDSYVLLTLAAAVNVGQVVSVSYTAGANPIRDEAGSAAADVSNRAVVHNRAPSYEGDTNLRMNAPPRTYLSLEVPASDFEDPDGDPLTFTVSADRDDVYVEGSIAYNKSIGRVFFEAKGHCELQHLTPPLPASPYDAVVTLTATDPHGATAQALVTFRVAYACPVLESATVNGPTLRLTYSVPLDTASTPAAGDFTVKVDGAAVSLATSNAVAMSRRGVTLTLAAAVSAGQAVTVSYAPSTNPILAVDGASAFVLTDEEVRNVTGDATAPALRSAAVDGATLTLIYGEALDPESTPGRGAFTVNVDGTDATLASGTGRAAPVWIRGPEVVLRLATAVTAGQTVTVSYDPPSSEQLLDLAGNLAASLDEEPVSNATTPELQSAAVDGATLTLTYDAALDADSEPAESAYTVTVDGTGVSLAATDPVAVAGSAVTLTLAAAVTPGQTVTVSYDPPDEDPIESSAGTAAAGLTDRAVTNTTAGPVLSRATVGSTTLVLFYDEALDADSEPATGDFTVTVAGSARAVSGVAVGDRSVILTLASAVNAGQTVTVSYTAGANPIRDGAGNVAANLANRSVTHNRAPSYEGPNVRGNNGIPNTLVSSGEVLASDFRDLDGDSLTFSVSTDRDDVYQEGGLVYSASVGRVFFLAKGHCELHYLTPPLPANPYDAVVTLTATDPHGATAQVMITFTVKTACPYLERATVHGATLRLTYSEPLDITSKPAAGDFTVKVDGAAVSLAPSSAVAMSLYGVTLTLGAAVSAGQAVTVSYTAGANPIRSAGSAVDVTAELTDEPVRNVTGDGTGPELQSAAVDGATSRLTLTYDEPLNPESEPAAGAFTVKVEGTVVALVASDPVRVRGRTVVLWLHQVQRAGQPSDSVRAGEEVTVSYAVPASGRIQDFAGNAADGLTDEEVRNVTGDGTAPELQSAAVDGATLTLTYDEALDPASEPAGSAYTVMVDGTGVSLAATDPVAVAGSAVTLTLAAAVAPGAAVTLSYAAPDGDPVQDLAGNAADGFTDRVVTNTSRRPVLSRATVGGDTLALFYDRSLDAASEPATGDFTVTVAGSGRGVSDVHVGDSYVLLTLAAAVNAGQAVSVSYTAGANPIRDQAGNGAANLSNQAVTHNRAPTYEGNTNLTQGNAYAGALHNLPVPASDFVDADGDPLTFTVSADRDDVYQEDGIAYNSDNGALFLHVKKSCALESITPALPEPFETVVTLTAADVHGATARATATFRTTRDTTPECLTLDSATVNGATLRLTYSAALNTHAHFAPEVGDFEVKVDGTAVRLAAANAVALAGRTVTLTLAAAVRAGQAVTLSYTRDDEDIQNRDSYAADLADHPVRNVTGDGAGPELQSAAVDGATLTLTYDEALDPVSEPGSGAFTVKVDGAAVTLAGTDPVAVSGSTVILTLAAAVRAGQAVTVSYTVPSRGPIQDFAGNAADGLTDEEVRNVSGDGTAPELQSAAVDGATLTLTYDEALDVESEPAGSAFTVKVDGTGVSLAATDPVGVAGSAVTLTLAAAVSADAVVTVSYTAPARDPVQDLAGNAADGFTDRAVTNATRPVLSRATVGGATLVLFYDRSLDGASEPAPGDFTVTVAGSGRGVSDVDVTDRYVILTLASAVNVGQTVTVSYTAGANPIRDQAGNGAVNLSNQAVTHNRAPTYNGDTNLTTSAPTSTWINLMVPASDFLDPDGDPLTFTVSAGRDDLYDDLSYGRESGFVSFQLKSACEVRDLTPALPADSFDAFATLTATDLHGATAQVTLTLQVSYLCGRFERATVNGATLRLTYSIPLDTASKAAPGDFEVKVNGVAVELADTEPVAISGSGVTLTLAAAVSAGQTVTVSYTAGTKPIRFRIGDDVDDLTDEPVSNVTGDGAAPMLQSAAVEGAALTLSYDEALDVESEPGTGAFTVKVEGTAVPLASSDPIRIAGAAVVLWLRAAVAAGQAVTVSYVKPTGAAAQPIRDRAGNAAAGLTDQEVVNATGTPAVSGVALVSAPSVDVDGDTTAETYAVGDAVRARVTFNQPVDVVGSPELKLRLAADSGERSMTFDAANALTGTTTLEFTYAVVAGDRSTAGIGFAANKLSVGAGVTIRKAGRTVDANLAFAEVAQDAGHQVDGVAPEVESAAVAGTVLRVTFDEPLGAAARLANTAFTVKKTPSGSSEEEEVGLSATVTPSISGAVLTLTLADAGAVTATDTDVNVSYAKPTQGSGNRLVDAVGNETASFDDQAVAHASAPTVTAVAVVSTPPAGQSDTYVAGDAVEVRVTFHVAVTVDTDAGTPRLKLDLGGDGTTGERWADYAGADDATAAVLTFSYTVAEGDVSSAGVAVVANTLEANGGTLRSAGDVDAALAHAAVAASASHKVDAAAPEVESATVAGTVLRVTFDEPLGAAARLANTAFTVKKTPSGSREETVGLSTTVTPSISGAVLTLTLADAGAVTANDTDVKVSYAKPTPGSGKRLVDAAGNEVADFDDHAVSNAVAPAVTAVAVVSAAGADDTYVAGDAVEVRVTFDAAVTVDTDNGTPRLKLDLGGNGTTGERWADYAGADDATATELTFSYTVAEGDVSSAGVAVVANTLEANGGTLRSAGDVDAALAHAGVAASASHKVDAAAPEVSSATVNGDTIELTWSKTLDGGSRPAAGDFEVTVAGNTVALASSNPVSIAGKTLTLTLALAVSAGEETVRVTYTAGSQPIRDVPGNAAASPATYTVTNNTPRPRPAFVDGNAAAFTIEENAAAGTAVGTLAVADGSSNLTFVLASTGTDHQSFVIDARGRIAVAHGAVLDYETKQSYSITVSVTDGEDDRGNREPAGTETIDDTIAVTITIANVEPPGVPTIDFQRTDQGVKAGVPLNGAIRLSWTPSSSGSPATHFRVHWWQTADYAGTVAHVDVAAQTGSQNYAVDKLTNGVSYSFALKAINREGESLFATGVSAIPYTDKATADRFSLIPTAGTGLRANRVPRFLRVSAETSGNLRVQWDAPSNTANVIDGYEIAWTSSSSFADPHPQEVELQGNARSHTIATLTGGQTYRLRVTTVYRRDSFAEATFRAPAYVSGTALTGPSAVADLKVEPDDGELHVRWAPPASGGGLPLAHYEVRWGPAGGAPEGKAKVGLVQAYSVAGLTNGQEYKVEVRAVNRGTDPNAGGNKALRGFEGAFAAVTASPNAPPTSSDVVKETQEDTDLVFARSDFPFTDAGDALAAVTVVTLPDATHGALYFGNPRKAVSAGDRVVAANLDALVFAPASGYVGSASFRFKVEDSAGAESGANTVFVRVLEGPPALGRSVLGVSLVSKPGADATYAADDTIRVRATFTGSVNMPSGTHSNAGLKLEFVNGDNRVQKSAAYDSGNGTGSLEFTYEVEAQDAAPDGVGIVANSLAGIQDTSSPLDLAHSALAADTGHKVDGVAPGVMGAPTLVSAPSSGDTYGRGEHIEVGLTFSEPVNVNGAPQLDVLVGAETRTATYRSGSGTATLIFRYTVAAADADADGVSIPAGTVALQGGAVTDPPGNAATLAYTALAALAAHKVKANTVPVAHAGSDVTVAAGAIVVLDGRASADADGDTLTYAWEQTSGTSVTLDDKTLVRPAFTAPAASADLEFSLTVSDGVVTSAASTVSVTVDTSVAAPVFAPADGAMVTDAGTDITLTFAEALRKDADGAVLGNADLAAILTLKRTDENGADIGFSATIDTADTAKTVITVDPEADLSDGAVYVAISNGYFDARGNQGAEAAATFTVDTILAGPVFAPADGATVTGAGTDITLTFAEAVWKDAAGAEFGNADLAGILTLKRTDENGADIGFSASIDAAKQMITVNPAADLSDGAVYVAISDGYFDAAGNQGAAAAATFTVDTIVAAPAFRPADGVRVGDAGRNITLTFAEAVSKDADGGEFGNADLAGILTLKRTDENGADIGFSASIDAAKQVITVDPTADLADGAVYVAISDGYFDAAGNQGAAAAATFTMVTSVAAPVFSPAAGATVTDAGTDITLTFAEALRKDADGAELADADLGGILTLKRTDENGADIGFSASIDAAKQVITIDPTADLADGAVYVAISDGYFDAEGNQRVAAAATFTVDTSVAAPAFRPADGAPVGDAGTNITLTFAEAVWKDAAGGELADADLAGILTLKRTDENGADIGFSASIDAAKQVITVDPTADLADGAVYVAISDGYFDAVGNRGAAADATFTVDTTGPAPVFAPAAGATVSDAGTNITLTFAEAVWKDADGGELADAGLAGILTLKRTDENGDDIGFSASIDAAKVITVDPTADLAEGAVYVAISNGYFDAVGNRGAAADATFTVDTTGPAAPVFAPAADATVSDAGTNITLTFAEAVWKDADGGEFADADLAGILTLKRTDENGADIGFSASIDAAKVITVDPTADLADGAVYVAISSGYFDAVGNPGAAADATFTVDTTAPAFSSASVNGAKLTVTFDEALAAAASLANSAFTVKKTPSGGMETNVSLSTTAPSISGSTVVLTLASAVAATDGSVKVSYTKPATGTDNKIKDAVGNETASFSDQAAANKTDPAITIVAGTSPVTEGTAAEFTVTADVAPSAALTVNLTVADASGSDFVAAGDEGSKTVAIAVNTTSATYSVATVGDTTDEPDGDVTVTVASGTGYTVGSTASASVTVNDDDSPPDTTAPDFGTATVANQNYALNVAITDLVLPEATGGDGVLAYALTPALPAGLSFDASTRTLSGTPTAGHFVATYTYKVTDEDANTEDSDADTLTFTIVVPFGCAGSTAVGGSTVTSGGLVNDCEALLPRRRRWWARARRSTGTRARRWRTGAA